MAGVLDTTAIYTLQRKARIEQTEKNRKEQIEKKQMEKKQSISEIKSQFADADISAYAELIGHFLSDEREGVKKLLLSYQKKLDAYNNELQRMKTMFQYERQHADCEYICGIDEVGRGPLAGPVVAAAVILPKDCDILYLNDSKQLSEKKREELYAEILEKAVAYGVGMADEKRIDAINILNADYEAMRMAIQKLSVQPDLLLNDAVKIPEVSIPQISIIKGDAKSASIAAASIVAKVTRDRLMVSYDELYPGYGFAKNKGYGSKEHIDAIKAKGPCEIHRRSFITHFWQEQ